MPGTGWLRDSVIYQIFMPSFADGDGDGIGDLKGLCQIMAYWLARGVAGFRIDMAYSLVKDAPDFAATVALWADLRAWVQVRYPDAVLLPENDYRLAPGMGARAGFDADFFLVIEQSHSLLFNNGGAGTLQTLPEHSGCYFDASAPDPDATLGAFLRKWEEHQAGSGGRRLVVLPTADHDFSRLATAPRAAAELRTAATTTIPACGYPLVYARGDRHLVVVNPSRTVRTADIPSLAARTARPLEASGTAVSGGRVETGAFGYGVFALEPAVGQSTAVTLPAEVASPS
jgi:glycosidase